MEENEPLSLEFITPGGKTVKVQTPVGSGGSIRYNIFVDDYLAGYIFWHKDSRTYDREKGFIKYPIEWEYVINKPFTEKQFDYIKDQLSLFVSQAAPKTGQG